MKSQEIYLITRKILTKFGSNLVEIRLKIALGKWKKTAEKKTLLSRYGHIGLNNNHKFSGGGKWKVTPYMQNLMILSGQEDNYQRSQMYMEFFLRVSSDDSQINRMCQHYGDLLEVESIETQNCIVEKAEELLSKTQKDIPLYVMVDGCQIQTREKDGKWREMKLCRVFSAGEHFQDIKKRNFIESSLYVSHFGSSDDFIDKTENIVDVFDKLGKNLVFVNDGASWINNWIKGSYANATNILDYFHAVEYLHEFVKEVSSIQEATKWVKEQESLLLNDEVEKVLGNIKNVICKNKKEEEAQNKVRGYYQNNQDRMMYGTYKTRGLLIGSGPIESAHRFVLQKRMKQSGQMWTREGGQAIANLRTANLSGLWGNVIELINHDFYQKTA